MVRVRQLEVWLHDQHVAFLRAPGIGKIRVHYTAEALASHDLGIPLLSCSLPLRTAALDGWAFATGLLPEGRHRQAMAGLAGVPTHDVLGMLARFGRDVAGALVVSEVPAPASDPIVEPYGTAGLEQAVGELGDHPLGLFDDSELSVAGLQDKMLLVALPGGGWGRPVHGWPSTHILKLDDRLRPGLVRAEHACLELARAAGLPAAASEFVTIGEAECLIVTRFDRLELPAGVDPIALAPAVRVHQEDACQATGTDPDGARGRAKYEQHGGPTLKTIAGLLDAWGGNEQMWALLDQVVLTVVIGNADAHAKNIALLHRAPGQVELSPAYDTVPTVLWPRIGTRAALSIGGCVDLPAVTVDDLVGEASRWGLSATTARARVRRVLDALRTAGTVLGDEIDSAVLAAATARVDALIGR
ncbi:MAG: HipA domain-containing protein [Mycobacteriales bacterium]